MLLLHPEICNIPSYFLFRKPSSVFIGPMQCKCNKNLEDRSNEYYEEVDKLKKINNTNDQKIQELEKRL